MRRPAGARPGGSLYPVLIITGILFMLSAMLPQVLVQASSAIRIDRSRDRLMDAIDSGVAFAEARLKRDLSQLVAMGAAEVAAQQGKNGQVPTSFYVPEAGAPQIRNLSGWVVRPTFSNPDFGHNHDLDFEVRCAHARLFHINRVGFVEQFQFSYTLDAGAWEVVDTHHYSIHKIGPSKHVEVNGVVTVDAMLGARGGRSITGVHIQGINREIGSGYVPIPPGATPPPLDPVMPSAKP